MRHFAVYAVYPKNHDRLVVTVEQLVCIQAEKNGWIRMYLHG